LLQKRPGALFEKRPSVLRVYGHSHDPFWLEWLYWVNIRPKYFFRIFGEAYLGPSAGPLFQKRGALFQKRPSVLRAYGQSHDPFWLEWLYWVNIGPKYFFRNFGEAYVGPRAGPLFEKRGALFEKRPSVLRVYGQSHDPFWLEWLYGVNIRPKYFFLIFRETYLGPRAGALFEKRGALFEKRPSVLRVYGQSHDPFGWNGYIGSILAQNIFFRFLGRHT